MNITFVRMSMFHGSHDDDNYNNNNDIIVISVRRHIDNRRVRRVRCAKSC